MGIVFPHRIYMPRRKEVLSYSSWTRNIAEIFIFTTICLLTQAQQNKQKNWFPSCVNSFTALSDHSTHPGVRHSCSGDLHTAFPTSHQWRGKQTRSSEWWCPWVPQDARLQSTHLTRSAGSGSPAVELHLFPDTGVKAEGQEEKHYYARLAKCRGAQLTGARASCPASTQSGTDAISGQNKWHHDVPIRNVTSHGIKSGIS